MNTQSHAQKPSELDRQADREKQKKILRSEAHDICRVTCQMIAARSGRLEMTADFPDFRYVGQWLLEETVSQLQQRI